MSEEEIIDQLISLKHHCASMEDEIFKDDVKAIKRNFRIIQQRKRKEQEIRTRN